MGKFNKGLFLGGLLGAGLAWMTFTPKGRQTRDRLLDDAARIYEEVKQRLTDSDAWQDLTKQKYVAMVRDAVNTYAVETGLADKTRETIMRLVSSQWGRLERELKKRKK